VYGGLIAVAIPADATQVHLEYKPLGARAAALACWLGLLAAIALIVRPGPLSTSRYS